MSGSPLMKGHFFMGDEGNGDAASWQYYCSNVLAVLTVMSAVE